MASKTAQVLDKTAEKAEKQAVKAAKATEEIIEETLEVIEDTLDTMERIPKVALNGTTRKQGILILTTVAVVAGAGGVAAGYFYAKKKLTSEFSELASKEIAEARERYRIVRNEDYESPQAAVDALISSEDQLENETLIDLENESLIDELQYRSPTDGPAQKVIGQVTATRETPEGFEAEIQLDEGMRVENVFVNSTPVENEEWDVEAEMKKREEADPEAPYVIEHDEFYNNESEFEQASLTYFEGDDVLVDSTDTPISDTNATVGDDNLTRFGHGSRDEHIVYVRNPKLEVEFEIARSKGNYTVEVLGLDHVVQHSERRSQRRFRPDVDD